MDGDDGTNHGGDDDGVAEVSLHGVGLHAGLETLLRLHALLDEVQVLGLVADSGAVSSATGAEQVVQLVLGQLQDLVQVDATVLELSEGSLFGCSGCVCHDSKSLQYKRNDKKEHPKQNPRHFDVIISFKQNVSFLIYSHLTRQQMRL